MIRVVNQTTGATDDNTEKVDGLGRVIHQTHLTGGGRVQVDTTYDAIGRVASRSNPCYAGASDATCGVTQTAYDALGRVVKVTRPDGSFAGSAYQDNCTTGTDEVGRQRRVCS